MLEFNIDVVEIHKYPIIHVKGEIDIHTCETLSSALQALIKKGKINIVLDLAAVHYIDSTGLGAIAQAAMAIMLENGKIHVVCSKPHINRIFTVSGLIRKNVALFENEVDALQF